LPKKRPDLAPVDIQNVTGKGIKKPFGFRRVFSESKGSTTFKSIVFDLLI
jgi:hypothetical protein